MKKSLKFVSLPKPLTIKVKIANPLDIAGTEAKTVPQLAGATVANFNAGSSPRGELKVYGRQR